MFPIPDLALFILAVLLGVAVATAVWLVRRRDCDWFEVVAMGTIGGGGGALCVMLVMPMTGAALPFPLKPLFVTSAIASAFCQFFHDYRRPRR
jgi:hypothetical protein